MNVYILYSTLISQYYVGITANINDRLERHNGGRSNSTKRGIPWQIIRLIDVNTRSQTMLLEKKIKQRGIARWWSENP